MNMKRTEVIVTMATLGLAGALGSVIGQAEETVSLDQVPSAVRDTIRKHAGDKTIVKIEEEMEGGKAVYEVELDVNGQEEEFQIAPDGTYLGPEAEDGDSDDTEGADDDESAEDDNESTIAWEQLPEGVKAGLTAALGGSSPAKVIKEEEDDDVYYEAEFEANGVEHTVKVTEDGDVVESEKELSNDELPEAIAAKLQKLDAKIVEAELVTVTFYEVEIEKDGKKREVKLYANGQRVEEDED